jgi:sigma-B regulation protein RsbU (phosphoserine phosphatase)
VYRRQLIAKERLAKEIEIAQKIQSSLWPRDFPTVEGFEISGCSLPATEVGGDLYHFFLMKMERRVVLSVGDVSGKGVPAALYSAVSSGMLRIESQGLARSASDMLNSMNEALYSNDSETFVCLCCATIDIDNHTATLANAGLSYPVYSTAEKTVPVELDGLPLGIDPDATYDEEEIVLHTGDILVLSSDGVVEAMNKYNELFGEERFVEVVRKNRNLSAADLMNKVVEEVKNFSQEASRVDDLTVMVVKCLA